jgi:hypothetical protein
MRKLILIGFCLFLFSSLSAQLALSKMVGKNADKYRLGYNLFSFFDIPLNYENQSIRVELMDLAYYPGKDGNGFTTGSASCYLSIKIGYKYVFSETRTGFYLEPAAGYCRVVTAFEGEDATFGDGIAGALEGGYSLEVGERGHMFHFGLKCETDRAGSAHTINSVSFRVSYQFNLFRRMQSSM